MSSLCILEIKPLSEVSLANIFSLMVGSLYICLMFSLAVQIFILMKFHLFILSFMSLALGDISVKVLLCEISEIFLPMFSSRRREAGEPGSSFSFLVSLVVSYRDGELRGTGVRGRHDNSHCY